MEWVNFMADARVKLASSEQERLNISHMEKRQKEASQGREKTANVKFNNEKIQLRGNSIKKNM